MLIAVTAHDAVGYVILFLAAAFAAMNVTGGYVVTGRMLKMFRKRPTIQAGTGPGAITAAAKVPAPDSTTTANGARKPGQRCADQHLDVVTLLIYILAASCFVLGLHLMNNPATARRGNQISGAGMVTAVATTLAIIIHSNRVTTTGWIVLLAGVLVGGAAGLYSARTVQMTAMPQLVSIFNAVGGGAAALVGIHDYMQAGSSASATTSVTTLLDVIIGGVTFSGSIIAAGKLQGIITSAPVTFLGARAVNGLLAVIAVGSGAYLYRVCWPGFTIGIVASLIFGCRW